ncbi:MAG: type II toxin-antitoxin system HicA family toxin [Nitrospirae bacterium]|nr:type II toxin-antitoxin system HicA family toxin [Nitrospirota bacterium]
MPKIPRDLSGKELATLLDQYGYKITRQTGSHIRLTTNTGDKEHHITIPNHTPLKVGTMNTIIRDIAGHLKIDRQLFVQELFKNS